MKNKQFRPRPMLFRGLNAAWKATYPLGGEIRLDKDDIIRRARKITGLNDLGSDFWDEPFDRMMRSVNEEARLHPFGRFITRERLVSLVSIRLRAEHFFKRYPQILEQELYPAWIIVGLQRTGTTKLQRLLAADPAHRVIPSWEVINPAPMDLNFRPGDAWPDPKRVRVANVSVKAVKLMSPQFFAIHPIDAMQPEEDILMLDVSFLSTTTEAMMHVPSYASWLETVDQSPAYAYAVKLLKLLQWVKPAKRWVLKTPHHLEFPHLILKHFNKVNFIWPHRDIYESVPSYLSMLTYNYMMFSDEVDVNRIAGHWVRKTGYMLDQALRFRLQSDNDSLFTDIYYKDLVTDSMKELDRLYRLDGGLNETLIRSFRQHEAEHPHRKHGVHQYSMGDFGLSQSDIDRHTSLYQEFMNQHYGRKQAAEIPESR
jgi:hypothetical protein